MGEIAEALRRAREGRELLAGGTAAPRGMVRVGARKTVAGPARRRVTRRPKAAKPEPQSRRVDASKVLKISRTRKKGENWAARAVVVDRAGPIAECYRHFAIRVRRELEERAINTVLVTSALPEEGKTVTAQRSMAASASPPARAKVMPSTNVNGTHAMCGTLRRMFAAACLGSFGDGITRFNICKNNSR